jgi:hypothetical protein
MERAATASSWRAWYKSSTSDMEYEKRRSTMAERRKVRMDSLRGLLVPILLAIPTPMAA